MSTVVNSIKKHDKKNVNTVNSKKGRTVDKTDAPNTLGKIHNTALSTVSTVYTYIT